eukprot:Nk52_evm90s207 gene=Nk52_evmTU90s207
MATRAEKHMSCPPRMSDIVAQQAAVNSGQQKNNGLYKTELCHSFEETNYCKYGDKCKFAHGRHELRRVSRHPKYKTDLCKTFHTVGTCPYGTRCHFIHNLDELPAQTEASDSEAPSVNSTIDMLKGNRQTAGSGASSDAEASRSRELSPPPNLSSTVDELEANRLSFIENGITGLNIGEESQYRAPVDPNGRENQRYSVGSWNQPQIPYGQENYLAYVAASQQAGSGPGADGMGMMKGNGLMQNAHNGANNRFSVPIFAEAAFGGTQRYQPDQQSMGSMGSRGFHSPSNDHEVASTVGSMGTGNSVLGLPPSVHMNNSQGNNPTTKVRSGSNLSSSSSSSYTTNVNNLPTAQLKDTPATIPEGVPMGSLPHEMSEPIAINGSSRNNRGMAGSRHSYGGSIGMTNTPASYSSVNSNQAVYYPSEGTISPRPPLPAHPTHSKHHSVPISYASVANSKSDAPTISQHAPEGDGGGHDGAGDSDDDSNSKKRLPIFAHLGTSF